MRQQIMTIRPIVRYPDPRLALLAQPVTVFDGALRDLASDLLDTMHAAPGIGITAPHIGVSLRVVVLDLDPIDGARTYVNPEITWASPEMIAHQEGSVSMPGVHDDIRRHARVRISYRNIDGNSQTKESGGLRAVCHQHEIDQLNGDVLDPAAVPLEARAADQAFRETVAGMRRLRNLDALSS
jgi:peptide deformylase